MTIEEIGQRVKRDFPGAYDGKSDFKVGQLAIRNNEKYRSLAEEGVQEQISKTGQREKGMAEEPETIGEFAKKELTIGTEPGEVSIGERGIGGFGKRFAKSAIKGITSPIAQARMPGRVAETAMRLGDIQGLSETRKDLADSTTKLIKEWRTTKDKERKNKLQGIIDKNYSNMEMINRREMASEERIFSLKQAVGTTLEAEATAYSMGTGTPATLLGQAKKRAVLGAIDAAGRATREEEEAGGITISAVAGGALGAASPYIEAGISNVWEGTRNAAKKVASALRGKTRGSMDILLDNPKAAAQGLRKTAKSGEEQEKLYQKVVSGLSNLRKDRNNSWQEAEEQLYNQNRGWKADLSDLKSRVATIYRRDFDALDGRGEFWKGRTPFQPPAETQAGKMWKLTQNWKRPSVKGLMALRNKVDRFIEYRGGNEKVNALAYAVKKEVDDELMELDGYELMKQNYKLQSDLINKVIKDLKVAHDKSPRMAMNILTSIFDKGSPYRESVLREFSEYAGKDVLAEVAGMAYSEWIPGGITQRIVAAEAVSAVARGGVTPAEAVTTGAVAAVGSPRLAAEKALAGQAVKDFAKETVEAAFPTFQKAIRSLATDNAGKIKRTAILELIKALTSPK